MNLQLAAVLALETGKQLATQSNYFLALSDKQLAETLQLPNVLNRAEEVPGSEFC